MSALPERLQDLLDLLVPDRVDRIEVLISTANRFRIVPSEVATRPYSDQHKVPACESNPMRMRGHWATKMARRPFTSLSRTRKAFWPKPCRHGQRSKD